MWSVVSRSEPVRLIRGKFKSIPSLQVDTFGVGAPGMTEEQGEVPRGVLYEAQDRFLKIDMGTVCWLSDTFLTGLIGEHSGSLLGAKICVHDRKSD